MTPAMSDFLILLYKRCVVDEQDDAVGYPFFLRLLHEGVVSPVVGKIKEGEDTSQHDDAEKEHAEHHVAVQFGCAVIA